jgi:L-malate glycosyltransferase
MKILHTVEFYYPSIGGAQEVVRQLSEHMVAQGHQVTVATAKLPERTSLSHNGVEIKEFSISGNNVRGLTGDIESYKRFLIESDFDVIMNYAAQQWATDIFFEIMDSIKAKTVFVPCGFSGLYDPDYTNYFEQMPAWLKKYGASVYLSNNYRDIDFARKHKIPNIKVVPNGAEEAEFLAPNNADIRRQLGIPEDDNLILTVGSHTGTKGHSEAIEMFRQADITNSTLLIVANGTSNCYVSCRRQAFLSRLRPEMRKTGKRIVVAALSRPATVAAYKSANIFLFPSQIEASPLVLFEASAAKTAFLTTDVGNSREIIKWTGGGVLLKTDVDKKGYAHADISAGSAQLTKLLADKPQLESLGQTGFSNWKKHFTWTKIAQQYLELYREVRK